MRRREFIAALGGAAAWPLAARAQQTDRVRRIGALTTQAATDPENTKRAAIFGEALAQLGWFDGRNLQINWRSTAGDSHVRRKTASELVDFAPEAILAVGSGATGALLEVTRSVPIVFTFVPDPVGAGFVDSMARPSGNVTGFTPFDYGMSAKWLELLKQVAPGVSRAIVLRDAATTGGIGQFGALQSAAPSLGMELRPLDPKNAEEIERGLAAFARSPNGGMIVTGSALALLHRDLIVRTANRYRMPLVSQSRVFPEAGGLISYGAERFEQFRQAAGYIDRILKGAKPDDLPVQAPTQYELVINLRAAKAIGVAVPPSLLAGATEVIE